MIVDDDEEILAENAGQPDDSGVHTKRRGAEPDRQFNSSSAPEADYDSLSPEKLKDAEKAGASEPDQPIVDPAENDQFYKDDGDKRQNRGRKRKIFTRRRLIGGGLIGVFGGGIFAVLLFFSPLLHLESILSRANERAFALAAHAVESRLSHHFDTYLLKHVIDLDRCGNIVNNMCRDSIEGQGMVTGLFRAWRDAKVEERLFNEFGFELQSTRNPDTSSGIVRYTLKDQRGNVINITNGTLTDYNLTNENFTGGRRELGQEMRAFLKKETRWYQVLQRRSVRKYLSRKHNVKNWCFFACKTKDRLEDKAVSAKTRLKYKSIEKFVYPFSEKYGFIMDCITSGGADKCSGESLRSRGIDRTALPDSEVEDIVKLFDPNLPEGRPNLRLSQYVLEKLLVKVMAPQAARVVVSAIPVAGQIYLGAVMIDMYDRMDSCLEDNCLSKFAADLNSRQVLEYYTTMRTLNDELKSGSLSLEESEAINAEFVGAETSKLYQARYATQTTASLFGTKAFAQSTESTEESYKCANGKPIPADKLVCPEKKIARTFAIEDIRDNAIVDGLSNTLNVYSPNDCKLLPLPTDPCYPIRKTLGGIDKISSTLLGGALGAATAVLEKLPGVGSIISFAKNKSEQLVMAFFGKIFPLPVKEDSPPRDKSDALEAGAEVAAAEFAKGGYTEAGESYGLGAPKVSDSEASAIMQDYFEQQEYEYKSLGLFAKLTDREHSGSIMNRIIAGTPSSINQVPGRVASGFPKIFSSIFNINIFSSFFGGTPAHAQISASAAANPFGITRHAYSSTHPAIIADPELLTPEYCQNAKAAWLASMTEDETTGFDEYSVANPCLLEEAAIEAGGGKYTGNYDLQADAPAPSNDPAHIPTADLGKSSDHIQCGGGSKSIGTTRSQYEGNLKSQSAPIMLRLCQLTEIDGNGNNPTGGRITGGAVVNSLVSGAWQALGKQAKANGVPLTASSSFRLADSCGGEGDGSACAKPGTSMHQLGIAIDFDGTHVQGESTTSCSARARDPGSKVWSWLFKNAERFGFKQYTLESWHWDAAPLANRCGSTQ